MTARILSIAALVVLVGVGAARSPRGQDAAVKKGEQVYAAQKCQICHAIAGKGSKANPLDGVGKKLCADDIGVDRHPTEMTAKTKSTKKPPMPAKYGKLAGGRPRRARRLPAAA